MSDTYGLERYKEAMLATAEILYPPPPPLPPPVVSRPYRPKGRRLPPRATITAFRAPAGYMLVGPYIVPIDPIASISEIQATVAEHYGIAPAEMTSARRADGVARPRQVAMYLSKQLTPRSLPEIGRHFGGRDHTTVIHAIRAVEHRRAEDPKLEHDIRTIRGRLQGGA